MLLCFCFVCVKGKPTICCLQETHFIDKIKNCLRVKGWKKVYQANAMWKQAGVAIIISDKVDFKFKLLRRDKEEYLKLIKVTRHQEKITITKLYVHSASAPTFIKHTLMDLKSQIHKNTVVVGDFNTPLSPIGRSFRQKINKEILELNDTTLYILLSRLWSFPKKKPYPRV
jgi:exonuclease III